MEVRPPMEQMPLTELRTSRPWHWIGTTAALVVLVLGLGTFLFFSRQSLGTERERTADLRDELAASQEQATTLEEDVTALEGEVNGLRISGAEFESRAQTCVAGLQDAVDAVDGALFTEDWLTFFQRSADVRRVCQRVLSGSITDLL